MKKILFILVLMCLEKALHAQYVYTIKADSVKITNTCDTAELIIENHTQTVPGFLFNRGRGRTEFRRIAQLDDTSVVVGGDTIHLGRGNRNFANADLTFDGDHWHDGALHEGGLYNFNQIGFQVNDADFNNNADMSLSQNNGYLLYMSKYTGNNKSYNSSHTVRYGDVSMAVDNFDNGTFSQTSVNLLGSQCGMYGSYLNSHTGEVYSGRFSYGFDIDNDRSDMNLGVSNGSIHIQTGDRRNNLDQTFSVTLNNTDSLTFYAMTWPDTVTRFVQTRAGFTFRRLGNNMNFRIPGLPASASSTDSMLVVDNNGQVKKRAQPSTVSSAIVIANGAVADVTAAVGTLTKLPDLSGSGSHSVILPPASTYSGQKIYIWNMNSSTNSWAFSSSITLPNGATTNSIPNQSTIELISDGNVWLKWN
jgi:hypothetical protein